MPHEFLTFRDQRTEGRHPIRLYTRYINKVGGGMQGGGCKEGWEGREVDGLWRGRTGRARGKAGHHELVGRGRGSYVSKPEAGSITGLPMRF